MKFLVDAQLPRRIAIRLTEAGYDARHMLDLPNENRTTDAEILQIAASEQRIVVTKDKDLSGFNGRWSQSFNSAVRPRSLHPKCAR